MTYWWEQIDRDTEREALRNLIPDGGCLVLEGDGESGRPQAAVLMEETLEAFGYRTLRAEIEAGYPTSVRALLVELWKRLAPTPAPDEVPQWVRHAGSLTTGFIATQLKHFATEDRLGVILIDVDLLEPLSAAEVTTLSNLAHDTGWIIVITSNHQSASRWQALGSRDKRVVLRDFTYEDVRVCLQNTADLRTRGPGELETAVQTVVAAASGPIRPTLAYTVLKAWDTHGA